MKVPQWCTQNLWMKKIHSLHMHCMSHWWLSNRFDYITFILIRQAYTFRYLEFRINPTDQIFTKFTILAIFNNISLSSKYCSIAIYIYVYIYALDRVIFIWWRPHRPPLTCIFIKKKYTKFKHNVDISAPRWLWHMNRCITAFVLNPEMISNMPGDDSNIQSDIFICNDVFLYKIQITIIWNINVTCIWILVFLHYTIPYPIM